MSVGQTAASAGETALGVIDEARANLQKVFIGFLIGLVGTVWSLRAFLWDYLEGVTKSELNAIDAEQLDIIVRTPFDVILLQVKIGLIVGVLISIPLLVYFGRGALRRRGMLPEVNFSRRKQYGFFAAAAVLLVLGVVYAYLIFFPFMFQFLAENALQMEIKPQYDIVMWTQFLILLTLSFGLAAQVPLFMSVSAYTEIIRYETFRDKWKYAIIAIFGFGALFSPPDPFTQLMWGVPLVALYFFSLALAKLAANLSRAGAANDPAVRRGIIRKAIFTGILAAVGTVLVFVVARFDLVEVVSTELWPLLPEAVRPASTWSIEGWLPYSGLLGEVVFAIEAGVFIGLLITAIYAINVLRRPIPPSHHAMVAGDPADLDLRPLDATALKAAPIEAFAALEEDEAVAIAQQALEDNDHERAEVVLDRFDEAQEFAAEQAAAAAEADEGGPVSAVTSATTGVVDAFSEDETTEEDIGGYWHDFVFIYQSLTSRMFHIVAVFLAVTFGVFYWLYSGGIGQIRSDFLARLPEDTPIAPEEIDTVVALHPVEVLLFNVKISLVAAIIVVVPMILFYAWPAITERGFASGDRRVFFLWGGLLIVATLAGSYIGYTFVAPSIISALVFHAVDAGMVVTYRINSFAWMVVYTTLGIGILFDLVMSMLLFHTTGIIRFETMRKRWRGVVVWSLILGALLTPGSVLTMLLVVIPVILTYLLGLGLLWLLTIPWRFRSPDPAST